MQPGDSPEIEQLLDHACWQLVRSVPVGRLAVVVDGAPEIFPINHLVDHAAVVFRTAAGTKLSAADGHRVAFEVDGVDHLTGRAWSVVMKGRAKRMSALYDVVESFQMPLSAWQPGAKPIFVRIDVDAVSGRRFAPISALG